MKPLIPINKSSLLHLMVSSIRTPKEYIEQKAGVDYVKAPYMTWVADQYYPGWSFEIISERDVLDKEGKVIENIKLAKIVWREDIAPLDSDTPNIVVRQHFMTDSKTIAYSRNNKDQAVDMGNDLKGGSTDILKKLLNAGMNIADDVYRQVGPALYEWQIKRFEEVINQIKNEEIKEKYLSQLGTMAINQANAARAIKALENLI